MTANLQENLSKRSQLPLRANWTQLAPSPKNTTRNHDCKFTRKPVQTFTIAPTSKLNAIGTVTKKYHPQSCLQIYKKTCPNVHNCPYEQIERNWHRHEKILSTIMTANLQENLSKRSQLPLRANWTQLATKSTSKKCLKRRNENGIPLNFHKPWQYLIMERHPTAPSRLMQISS
jgi:hypothetical protein